MFLVLVIFYGGRYAKYLQTSCWCSSSPRDLNFLVSGIEPRALCILLVSCTLSFLKKMVFEALSSFVTPAYPQTCHPLASTSWVLRLQARATMCSHPLKNVFSGIYKWFDDMEHLLPTLIKCVTTWHSFDGSVFRVNYCFQVSVYTKKISLILPLVTKTQILSCSLWKCVNSLLEFEMML